MAAAVVTAVAFDMSKKILLSVALALIVVIAALFFFTSSKPKYTQEDPPIAVLSRSNEDYALGKNYFSQRNYDLAKEYYQKALTSAEDDIQRGQIQFSVAVADEFAGRYVDAVKAFKDIAIDSSSYQFVRAYAAQEIGLIYYGLTGADRDAVAAETFREPPFSAFKEGDDLNLAYRKVFEYAANIYPLGGAEARIAYWYADHIVSDEVERNSGQMLAEIAIVKQSIAKADADIERTINDPGAMAYIPGTYSLEARALTKLASVGAASNADAEALFQKSVNFADALGRYATDRFRYAEFLATVYGEERKGDIQQLLSTYRSTNDRLFASTVNLFKGSRQDPALADDKEALILLGQLDPGFKTYLISLGWYEADFQ